MCDKLLTLKEAERLLNVSKSTLQRWDRTGKLHAVRTEGNHRRYRQSDIDRIIGIEDTDGGNNEIVVATYARCSSADQKNHGDLDRQSTRLSEYCALRKYMVGHIIKDVGSGLNDKRKGFAKLCSLVVGRKINKVVIEHKDRLTRFQFNLIKFFFNSYGVDVELLDDKEYTQQEELVNDIMMLMASFSGKCYGQRAKENNAKRKQKSN